MTSVDPTSLTFPAECPRCHERAVIVRAARTVPDQRYAINLTVRCLSCSREWVIPKPVEAVPAPEDVR